MYILSNSVIVFHFRHTYEPYECIMVNFCGNWKVEDDNAFFKKVIYILIVDGDQPARNVCSTQKIVCHES